MSDSYNAAVDLIERNLTDSRANKTSVIDDHGRYTYAELAERVYRAANALRNLGLAPNDRVVLCLFDSIDFPTCFLGAIHAGIVPIPISTLATASDYAWVLTDSQARAAIVSDERMPVFLEPPRLPTCHGQFIPDLNALPPPPDP